MIQFLLLFLLTLAQEQTNTCQTPIELKPTITTPTSYTIQSTQFVTETINCVNKEMKGTWIKIINQYDDFVSFKMTFSENKETFWYTSCEMNCKNNTNYKYIYLDRSESQILFVSFETPYNTMSLEYISNSNETSPLIIIPELPQTVETSLSQKSENEKYVSYASFLAQKQWKYQITINANGKIKTIVECQSLNFKQSFESNSFQFESPQDNVEYKLTFEGSEKEVISIGFEDVEYQPTSIEIIETMPYLRYEVIPSTIVKRNVCGFEYQINTQKNMEYVIDLCSTQVNELKVHWIDTMFEPVQNVCSNGKGLNYSIIATSEENFNFMIGFEKESVYDRGFHVKIYQKEKEGIFDETSNIILISIICSIVLLIILVSVILVIIVILRKKYFKKEYEYETILSNSVSTVSEKELKHKFN